MKFQNSGLFRSSLSCQPGTLGFTCLQPGQTILRCVVHTPGFLHWLLIVFPVFCWIWILVLNAIKKVDISSPAFGKNVFISFCEFLCSIVYSLYWILKTKKPFFLAKRSLHDTAEPCGKPLSKPESCADSLKPALAHLSTAAAQWWDGGMVLATRFPWLPAFCFF